MTAGTRPVAVLAAIAAGLLLSACGDGDGATSTEAAGRSPAPVVPGDDGGVEVRPGLRAGQDVFFSSGCPACHAIGSAGSGELGGELTTVGAELSKADLARALRRGPGIMPSYDAMPPEMVDDLVDYLAALR